MIIKRYLLPGIGALAAYLVLGCIFEPVSGLYMAGLAITVLTAYFIRICDDICDFEQDRKAGKALLNRKALLGIGAGIVLVVLVCSIVFSAWWWLLSPGIIALQLLTKEKHRDFLKPLFIPCILLSLFHTAFAYSHWIWWLIGGAVLVDILIIIRKRWSRDTDR